MVEDRDKARIGINKTQDKTNQTGVADKVALTYRGQDPLRKR